MLFLGARFHLLVGILIRGRPKHRGAWVCACNGWRSDFLASYVEYSGGAFQDSHDGGAEAAILRYTLIYLHFYTIGPGMVAWRDSSREKPPYSTILWGNLSISTPYVPASRRGFADANPKSHSKERSSVQTERKMLLSACGW
jgi:hypothetical protein